MKQCRYVSHALLTVSAGGRTLRSADKTGVTLFRVNRYEMTEDSLWVHKEYTTIFICTRCIDRKRNHFFAASYDWEVHVLIYKRVLENQLNVFTMQQCSCF